MSPFYDVLVARTEIYTDTKRVEADSADAAKEATDAILATAGWDAVFDDGQDGEYSECTSEVVDVTEVEVPRDYAT